MCKHAELAHDLSLESLTYAYWVASQALRAPVINEGDYRVAQDLMNQFAAATAEDASDLLCQLARCEIYSLNERRRGNSDWKRADHVAAFLVARNRPQEMPIPSRIFPEDGPQGAA